ncbi:Integrin beta epidermal growth factor like domain 1 [Popillia japonica]|uniref:Integrin beta n=1 Tax=Popillia japonica TaxID=7064 RepID=A0AAW1M1L9_POPJA
MILTLRLIRTAWILDSGSTDHMCCHLSKFKDFKEKETIIEVAGGERLLSTGYGNIDFTISTYEITLLNVLYVPNLKCNLTSVNKMTERGLEKRTSVHPTMYLLGIHLLLLYPLVKCQAPETIILNPCVSKGTCHDCIQTPSCAWCFSPGFDRARCFQPSSPNPQSVICPEEYIYNPDNIQQILKQNKLSETSASSSYQSSSSSSYQHSQFFNSSSSTHSSSSSQSGSSYGYGQSEIVQISPQRVNLKLRARQSYTLKMSYKQAEDYPVDLYYLMDLSKSMEDDKEKLSKLGSLLAETMTNITSNFRLGFGSFVDKVVMPYVSTVHKKLKQPCTSCEAPYGFRNHMTLSTNTSQFSDMVNAASVSGNLDAPEGGFDAIMQAIVCRNDIGWREKARRLLVFSTDAGFHYAGDGKLGGIITPNDGFCHLDTVGLYTHSSLQDYPSISQINLKVKQNAINVIFAVTESQISVYHRLKEHIEGSSCGQLSNDSSNIVELVKSQYEQISSTVELKDNATSMLKVTYYSQCLNVSGSEKKTNKCGNIKVGDVVEFKIEIEVISCPADPKEWMQTLQIYPVGLNESLIVDIEMLCSCPCEKPDNPGYEKDSKKCSGHGTYKCGVCDCGPQHFGTTCQCTALGMNANIVDNCRPPNSTVDCSGRGVCSCGRCECYGRDDNEILPLLLSIRLVEEGLVINICIDFRWVISFS